MPTAHLRDLVVHYEESGPPEGAAVLLLHGLGGSSAVWADTRAALAAGGRRAVAADCRGHGATSKPPGPYSIEQMADDWAELHRRLALPPAHWVGSSMGGAIAMAAARRHPERVRSLVLVDTWAGTDPPFAALLDERLRVLEAGGLEAYAKVAFPQAHGEPYRQAHPEAFDLYLERVRQVDPTTFGAAVAALRAHDARFDLSEIRRPTTVMVGEIDTLLPPRYSEELAARIPGARLVRFSGVGHLPMVEAPTAFLRTLEEHLGRA